MKQGWKKILLKDACKIFTDGDWIESKDQSSEGIRLVQTGNIGFGYFKDKEDKSRFISEETFERLNCTEILAGDLLVSRLPDPVGKSCIIPEINSKMITGVDCTIIRPKDNISSEFLCYYQMSNQYLNDVQSAVSGATRQRISRKNLGLIEIPLPPLLEQQRIVAILDEAFAAIAKAKANAEQNLKNAKELFDVYLHKYYSSKDDGWEEKKLKEVAEYFNGLTYSPKNVSNEGIIVLRSSNVQNDELDFKDIVRVNLSVKEKIIVKEGDILMCSRNGSARLVGKTATIKNLDEEMTFGTFMMIVRSEYNPYLSWFFKSTDFRNQIKGGANTMINQITRYMLDDIILSFPPIEKQNKVVRQLDALSMEIKKLETIYNQKINDLEELKKSVLQKAFSGELK